MCRRGSAVDGFPGIKQLPCAQAASVQGGGGEIGRWGGGENNQCPMPTNQQLTTKRCTDAMFLASVLLTITYSKSNI
ncbi:MULTISPECIES: hypothetical protein [Fischerella]|uniref:hypothetical protein n=1 Tax=Fischerella TaxID=1190 RepID=UPI0012FC4D4D|nr:MULTISPECIES: hypothetical protein [Fischerella]